MVGENPDMEGACIPDAAGVYWYPYYLFMVLFLFSGSTLYFYKRS